MRIRATTKVSNATAPMRSLCAVVVPDRFLVAWIRDFPLRGFGVTSPMPPLFDQVSTLSQFPDSTALWVNDILVWIGFGILVGLLAKAIMPGRDPGGAVTTLLMGHRWSHHWLWSMVPVLQWSAGDSRQSAGHGRRDGRCIHVTLFLSLARRTLVSGGRGPSRSANARSPSSKIVSSPSRVYLRRLSGMLRLTD